MPEFNTIEDTLFVPMLGRIYASRYFSNVLYDSKALELEKKLPPHIKGKNTQTQYTLLAGAVRSANMDRYIRRFIKRHSGAIVVEIGCGLETAFYRNDDGKAIWYEVDLPNVIEYRESLLGTNERDQSISADAFGEEWIKQIRSEHPDAPMLVTGSGLFYYFEKKKILELFRNLKKYGNVEIVFDTVNHSGMKQMGRYMKQVGHEEASMYFYVDDGEALANEIDAVLLKEEAYYAHTDKRGMKLVTYLTMKISDCFKMVKMIHLKLN